MEPVASARVTSGMRIMILLLTLIPLSLARASFGPPTPVKAVAVVRAVQADGSLLLAVERFRGPETLGKGAGPWAKTTSFLVQPKDGAAPVLMPELVINMARIRSELRIAGAAAKGAKVGDRVLVLTGLGAYGARRVEGYRWTKATVLRVLAANEGDPLAWKRWSGPVTVKR